MTMHGAVQKAQKRKKLRNDRTIQIAHKADTIIQWTHHELRFISNKAVYPSALYQNNTKPESKD